MFEEFFGPNRNELWRQLAAQIGATYELHPVWHTSWVRLQHRQWTIVLDVHYQGKVNFTRMRARILNRDGFWFTIYPRGVVSTARKWLGMQDVVVGHERFDVDFIIQGNNEASLKALFDNAELRFLMESLPNVHFSIADHDHSFWGLPEGIDELCLTTKDEMRDLVRLKLLFALFQETLDELRRLGTISAEDPRVLI